MLKNLFRTSEVWMGLAAITAPILKTWLPHEVVDQFVPAAWTYVGGRVVSKLAKANVK